LFLCQKKGEKKKRERRKGGKKSIVLLLCGNVDNQMEPHDRNGKAKRSDELTRIGHHCVFDDAVCEGRVKKKEEENFRLRAKGIRCTFDSKHTTFEQNEVGQGQDVGVQNSFFPRLSIGFVGVFLDVPKE
jgi:hypothetical protein